LLVGCNSWGCKGYWGSLGVTNCWLGISETKTLWGICILSQVDSLESQQTGMTSIAETVVPEVDGRGGMSMGSIANSDGSSVAEVGGLGIGRLSVSNLSHWANSVGGSSIGHWSINSNSWVQV